MRAETGGVSDWRGPVAAGDTITPSLLTKYVMSDTVLYIVYVVNVKGIPIL